jgi:hypothetical protein
MNAKSPTKSTLAPEEVDEMEDFIDNAKIITIALGYKVFEKLCIVPEEISEGDETGGDFYIGVEDKTNKLIGFDRKSVDNERNY